MPFPAACWSMKEMENNTGRRDGSVIAPVPVEKGAEFAKAYGLSDKVVTKEEYRKIFGRELRW